MKHRLLRVAWSVAWSVLGLLLIGLSVRSFTWADQTALSFTSTNHLLLNSQLGGISISWVNTPRVIRTSRPVDSLYPNGQKPPMLGRVYFIHGQYGGGAPYWLLAIVCGAIATIPWKPWKWKFSLRTMLIGMTVVALLLGLSVWAAS